MKKEQKETLINKLDYLVDSIDQVGECIKEIRISKKSKEEIGGILGLLKIDCEHLKGLHDKINSLLIEPKKGK